MSVLENFTVLFRGFAFLVEHANFFFLSLFLILAIETVVAVATAAALVVAVANLFLLFLLLRNHHSAYCCRFAGCIDDGVGPGV